MDTREFKPEDVIMSSAFPIGERLPNGDIQIRATLAGIRGERLSVDPSRAHARYVVEESWPEGPIKARRLQPDGSYIKTAELIVFFSGYVGPHLISMSEVIVVGRKRLWRRTRDFCEFFPNFAWAWLRNELMV